LEALTSARKAAAELSAKDDFDGALALVKALPPETAQLVPDEVKSATDEIVASARKRVGAIEADVTKQLAAADFESARAQLAGLAKLKTTTALPEAKDLAEKLKSRIAAAEKQAAELAARRAREALAAALAEFDELLAAGDYDGARKHATRAAQALDKENKESKRVLAAAADLATIFPERHRVLLQKYADLAGTRVDIGTRQRARRGVTLKKVSDEGLTIEWTYRIGGEERSRTATVPWSQLSAKEIASRLADWRKGDPARPMSEAIVALRAKNVDEAERLLGDARGHPLRDWLARKIEIARRGAAEVAAEEAWEALKAAKPVKPTPKQASELLEGSYAEFNAAYGETEFYKQNKAAIEEDLEFLRLASIINFVVNGDFESGDLAPWIVPDNTNAVMKVSTDGGRTGGGCLYLKSSVLIEQSVELEPGEVYEFAGYVKGWSDRLRIYVRPADVDVRTVRGRDYKHSFRLERHLDDMSESDLPKLPWVPWRITFRAKSRAHFVGFHRMYRGTDVWLIDDVSLMKPRDKRATAPGASER
jgi:hypothetical protein